MPSTGVRSVCPNCRLVGAHTATDGGCARCGTRVLLVSSKWRAPRRTNDRAWRAVAAGTILWDKRAVRRAATRKAAARQVNQLSSRRVRRAAAIARAAVQAPPGHGTVRLRTFPGHPADCAVCLRGQAVFHSALERMAG